MQRKNWIIIICMAVVCPILLGGCGRRNPDWFAAEQRSEGIDTGLESSDMEADGELPSELLQSSGQAEPPTGLEEASEDNRMIAVYVCGAVLYPDVYYVEAGSIKQQALLAAGGFQEGAATEYVNLAEPVCDGEKLYFPYADEIERADILDSADRSDSEQDKEGIGKINLNTATREELMTLSGIGASKADAIIRYRDEHGFFQSVDELMQVNGIKDGTYNNVKDYVIVN